LNVCGDDDDQDERNEMRNKRPRLEYDLDRSGISEGKAVSMERRIVIEARD
jgi:hypothetical protein